MSRTSLHDATSNDADDRVERLFEDYSGRVYRYCLSRLASREDAEDALQATYLNAWRSLQNGVRPVATRPWLFQIAANVCSTVLRTKLNGRAVELRGPEALDRIPTRSEPSDELLGLSAALERLPERQRHALLLRDWRGLSYQEIATELDSSYEAVETLLFRARKAVAAGLTKPEPLRPVRARTAAPLALLVPFHHGWASAKSALSAGIAPVKVSLGIALGAAAPLVAYGLFERGVSEHSAPPRAAAVPIVRLEAPPAERMPVHVRVAPKQEERSRPAGASTAEHEPSSSTASAAAGEGDADTAAAGTVEPENPGPPVSPPSDVSPPPDTSPPPDVSPPPSADEGTRVAMCHHTGSSKNPDVTISIAPAAVDAHVGIGDELDPCA